MVEARLYKKLADKSVRCHLCSHRCLIKPGKRGICFVRENRDGTLYSLVYGLAIAANVDPIEKKPLFHFQPGSLSFSIATAGCNFRCEFCFDPQTNITTEKGILTLEEIFNLASSRKKIGRGEAAKINLKVLTHKGEKRKIKQVFRHNYQGKLLKIKPYYSPEIKCTPNHEFFATTNPSEGEIEKVKAANLSLRHFLVIPKNYSFSENLVLDAKETLFPYIGNYKKSRKTSYEDVLKILKDSENGIFSSQIGETFGLHPAYVRTLRSRLRKRPFDSKSILYEENSILELGDKIKFKTEKLPPIPRHIPFDEKFAKLLGYYCAEGWVTVLKDRPNSLELSFSFGKKEKKYINETTKLIQEVFGIKPRVSKRRTTITIEIGKTSLALLFKILAGSGASNKRVPEPINLSPKATIQAFLEGYVNGDGWINKNEISVNTTSQQLALGIYWLVLKCGHLPRFYTWHPSKTKKIEKRKVNQSILYYIKWRAAESTTVRERTASKFFKNDSYYFIPIFRIDSEEYSGPVYNLEVEKIHSYLANFIAVGNCQNWDISQITKGPKGQIIGEELSPEEIVKKARETSCDSVAYTYTEPTIFFEYAYDTAKLAKKKGLANVFVTNGYQTPETIKEMAKFVDGANVDLKSFSEEFYQKICGARLKPVLEAIKLMHQAGIWLEITTLVVPKQNDKDEELMQIAKFIAKVDKNIPWHISRFHPEYKMLEAQPTPLETLEKACQIGKKAGLKYVYLGNIITETGENTYCPQCGNLAIRRVGYEVEILGVDKEGNCPKCGENLNIKM